jgi:uncharacterized protein (TIGR01244 family)
MQKIIGSILLAVVMSTASFADEQSPAAAMKVDLATVVSDGTVEPVDGISTAGQPDKAAFEVFANAGYTTVIDMRTEREDRGLDAPAVVTELGMTYINMPIAGLDAISFENARELDKLLSEIDGPVLLHCGSANRVGALLALRKSLDGATDDEALEFGRAGGMTSLEKRVREVLDSE